jgi:Family of unknown function (DUF5694)
VLVLGVYHMANAGRDIFNMKADENTAERATQEVGLYYRQAHLGEPGDWAGADLVSDWVRRNVRIFSNVAQLVESPNERVLVIFGAGISSRLDERRSRARGREPGRALPVRRRVSARPDRV